MLRSGGARGWVALLFLAAGILGAASLTTEAGAAADDRAVAESLLKEVDASPKKEVASELSARSRAALERGARLRSAGDEAHAKIADSVAKTWAEGARDIVRAAAVEESAAAARRGANDAGLIADRERALLEEAIAQSGRLRAQMESVERDGKEQPARTSTSAISTSGDAGARKAPPPAPSVTKADGGAR